MKDKTGGPAFPGVRYEGNHGMTLRQYYAGQLLASGKGIPGKVVNSVEDIVSDCFDAADAMIKFEEEEK